MHTEKSTLVRGTTESCLERVRNAKEAGRWEWELGQWSQAPYGGDPPRPPCSRV